MAGEMQGRWGFSKQNTKSQPAQPEKITEYPRWVNGRIAKDAEEEAAFKLLAPPPPPPPDPPRRKPGQFVGENPLQAPLNAAYARMATLEGEIAKRDQIIARMEAEASAPEPEQPAENVLGSEPEPEIELSPETPEPAADVAAVEIPENWSEAHHRTRMSLARQITGQQPASAEEADATIRAEVARRGGQ